MYITLFDFTDMIIMLFYLGIYYRHFTFFLKICETIVHNGTASVCKGDDDGFKSYLRNDYFQFYTVMHKGSSKNFTLTKQLNNIIFPIQNYIIMELAF